MTEEKKKEFAGKLTTIGESIFLLASEVALSSHLKEFIQQRVENCNVTAQILNDMAMKGDPTGLEEIRKITHFLFGARAVVVTVDLVNQAFEQARQKSTQRSAQEVM